MRFRETLTRKWIQGNRDFINVGVDEEHEIYRISRGTPNNTKLYIALDRDGYRTDQLFLNNNIAVITRTTACSNE